MAVSEPSAETPMKISLRPLAIYGLTALSAISASPLYKDAAQPVDLRVQDLLARMTLGEKIGQLTQGGGSMLFADMHQSVAVAAEQLRESQRRCRAGTRAGGPPLCAGSRRRPRRAGTAP